MVIENCAVRVHKFGGMMAKTPLIERMEKKGAPKSWIAEVRGLHVNIKELLRTVNYYLDIIDKLAREVDDETEQKNTQEHG